MIMVVSYHARGDDKIVAPSDLRGRFKASLRVAMVAVWVYLGSRAARFNLNLTWRGVHVCSTAVAPRHAASKRVPNVSAQEHGSWDVSTSLSLTQHDGTTLCSR